MPSEGYPAHLLSVSELSNYIDEMKDFRKWMAELFPEDFPDKEKTNIPLVFATAKGLMLNYIRLRNLVSR